MRTKPYDSIVYIRLLFVLSSTHIIANTVPYSSLILTMHSLIRTLVVFGLLASSMMIYAVEAGSILSALGYGSVKTDNCAPAGADCGGEIPCCNKCRVNWGGAWCT